jgi:hypothetical protein
MSEPCDAQDKLKLRPAKGRSKSTGLPWQGRDGKSASTKAGAFEHKCFPVCILALRRVSQMYIKTKQMQT